MLLYYYYYYHYQYYYIGLIETHFDYINGKKLLYYYYRLEILYNILYVAKYQFKFIRDYFVICGFNFCTAILLLLNIFDLESCYRQRQAYRISFTLGRLK